MLLDFTYDTLLGSSSESLQRELKSDLGTNQFNGPSALFAILQLAYRNDDSKAESILKEIEALNLRDFAGQNVTLYKQKCDRLLEELEMNLPIGQVVPTLRTKALKGLNQCTFQFFQSKVTDII